MGRFDQSKQYLKDEFPGIFRPLRTGFYGAKEALKCRAIEALRDLTRGMKYFGPPSGLFSTYEELIAAGREDQIILPYQKGVEMPADSISSRSLNQHLDQPHPILWERYLNARLVSSSLGLMNEKKELNREGAYGDCHHGDPAYREIFHPKPVRLSGRWTSVISWWAPSNQPTNFAHWFYDALPRLNLLKHFPDDVGILIPAQVMRFQEESLRLLGLFDRCRPTPETHLILDEYYFSSPASMIVCWSPYAYDFLNKHFRPAYSGRTDTPKRLYIIRKGVTRGAANEAEVQALFSRLGWALIDAAELTLQEQIDYFRNAEAVCGLHGAGMVNMQWAEPGTHMIELFPASYISGCYELTALYQQLRYKAFVFPADISNRACVDLDMLGQYLSEQGLA